MKTSSPATLRRHVRALTAGGPRDFGSTAQARAREYIVGTLRRHGWDIRRLAFSVRPAISLNDDPRPRHPFPLRFFRRLDGVDIIAVPAWGIREARDWTALSAHYDTVPGSVGADDNTSGVAALLEAARLLKKTKSPITLVFFDREETGMQGADAWARRAGPSVSSLTNLEMVGHFVRDPDSNPVPLLARLTFPGAAGLLRARLYRRDSVIIVSDRRSRHLADSLAASCSGVGLPAIEVADPRPAGQVRHLFTPVLPATSLLERSDHSKFWNHGIPAVMATVGTPNATPHYHRATDTAPTLDYDRLAKVADAVVAHATRLAAVR